jgi:hypothetical protein
MPPFKVLSKATSVIFGGRNCPFSGRNQRRQGRLEILTKIGDLTFGTNSGTLTSPELESNAFEFSSHQVAIPLLVPQLYIMESRQ